MKIEFTMIHEESHSLELITSNLHNDYIFNNKDCIFEAVYNGNTITVVLQNGHSFLMGNYSLPSPNFDVYEVFINNETVSIENIEEPLKSSILELVNDCESEDDTNDYLYNVYKKDSYGMACGLLKSEVDYNELDHNDIRNNLIEVLQNENIFELLNIESINVFNYYELQALMVLQDMELHHKTTFATWDKDQFYELWEDVLNWIKDKETAYSYEQDCEWVDELYQRAV